MSLKEAIEYTISHVDKEAMILKRLIEKCFKLSYEDWCNYYEENNVNNGFKPIKTTFFYELEDGEVLVDTVEALVPKSITVFTSYFDNDVETNTLDDIVNIYNRYKDNPRLKQDFKRQRQLFNYLLEKNHVLLISRVVNKGIIYPRGEVNISTERKIPRLIDFYLDGKNVRFRLIASPVGDDIMKAAESKFKSLIEEKNKAGLKH